MAHIGQEVGLGHGGGFGRGARAGQLQLRRLAFGDIAHDVLGGDRLAPLVADQLRLALDPDPAAILVLGAVLEGDRRRVGAGRQNFNRHRLDSGRVVRVDNIQHRRAGEFLRRIAQHRTTGGADEGDHHVQVDLGDDIGGVLGQEAIARLAAADGFIGHLLRGDVAHHRDHAGNGAGLGIEGEGRLAFQPNPTAVLVQCAVGIEPGLRARSLQHLFQIGLAQARHVVGMNIVPRERVGIVVPLIAKDARNRWADIVEAYVQIGRHRRMHDDVIGLVGQQPEAFLARPQLILRALDFRHIRKGAEDGANLLVAVHLGCAATHHMTCLAVRAQQPQFKGEGRAVPQAGLHTGADQVLVIGMKQLDDGGRIQDALARIKAEDPENLVGPGHRPGGDLLPPIAHAGDLFGHGRPLLIFRGARLSGFSLGERFAQRFGQPPLVRHHRRRQQHGQGRGGQK